MPQEAILEKYPWAVNATKVSRAVQVLMAEVKNNARKEYSEEDVKNLYVSYGGALLEETIEEMGERSKYMRNAGPIQQVVETAAANLKKRVASIVKKPKKAE